MSDNPREQRREQFRQVPEAVFPALCEQLLRTWVDTPPEHRGHLREGTVDLWRVACERQLDLVYMLTLERLQAEKRERQAEAMKAARQP